MDDLTQLLRVTPATEVAKKWNVGAERLEEIVKTYGLPLYGIREKRVRPSDGQIVYFCSGPFRSFYDIEVDDYVLELLYFDADTVESHEAAYPELLWLPPIKSNACPTFSAAAVDEDPFASYTPSDLSEDIPAEQIRKELGMSRLQFVEFLNYGGEDNLPTSCEEEFSKYKDSYDHRDGKAPYYTIAMLESLTVERIDWENWKARQKAKQSETQDKEPAAKFSHDDEELRGRVVELESQLAEVQAERDRLSDALENANARIAELEAVVPSYDMALQERDAQIAAIQSEVKAVREIIIQNGALSVVVKMLEGGSTKEEVAQFLKDKGLSYSQVGVLLHADPLGVSGDAVAMCAKRLLGIASK